MCPYKLFKDFSCLSQPEINSGSNLKDEIVVKYYNNTWILVFTEATLV